MVVTLISSINGGGDDKATALFNSMVDIDFNNSIPSERAGAFAAAAPTAAAANDDPLESDLPHFNPSKREGKTSLQPHIHPPPQPPPPPPRNEHRQQS